MQLLKHSCGHFGFFTRLTKEFSRELLSFSCPANNSIGDLTKKRPTCLHTYIHTNQTRIKCWSVGATLRAEQWPCEPSKGFVSKSGERERARESQRESLLLCVALCCSVSRRKWHALRSEPTNLTISISRCVPIWTAACTSLPYPWYDSHIHIL